jgi:hypothetical protein
MCQVEEGIRLFIRGTVHFKLDPLCLPFIRLLLREEKIRDDGFTLEEERIRIHDESYRGEKRNAFDNLCAFIILNGQLISMEEVYIQEGAIMTTYAYINEEIVCKHFKPKQYFEETVSFFKMAKKLYREKILLVEILSSKSTTKPIDLETTGLRKGLELFKLWRIQRKKTTSAVLLVTPTHKFVRERTDYKRAKGWKLNKYIDGEKTHGISRHPLAKQSLNLAQQKRILYQGEEYLLDPYIIQKDPEEKLVGEDYSACDMCTYRLRNLTGGCKPCTPKLMKQGVSG